MSKHTGERPFKCDKCEKGFVLFSKMKKHRKVHEGVDPGVLKSTFNCEECGQMFSTKQSLRTHNMSKHTGERPFKCDECGKGFVLLSKMKKHRKVHDGVDHEVEDTGSTPKHPCPECGKMLTHKGSLRVHIMARHTGERPFKCDSSEKGFVTATKLKKHVRRVHEQTAGDAGDLVEIPQLPCQECGKMIKGERPFKCDVCDKGFVTATYMKTHKRAHHGPGNQVKITEFPCPNCDKKFTTRQDAKRHLMQIHTGERPFQCDICEKGFIAAYLLNKHKRDSH